MSKQFVDGWHERLECFVVLVCHRTTNTVECLYQFFGSRRFAVMTSCIEVTCWESPNEMEIHGPMIEERRHHRDGLVWVSDDISIYQA